MPKIAGEVVIGDNGSTDGSQEIARNAGARVVDVPRRGYGAALMGAIEGARGKYVIMGDSDDSYDFSNLDPFVEKLRAGYDLVMGNRFKGGIAPGAMPFLHRYLGNPVLSFIGRLFFRATSATSTAACAAFARTSSGARPPDHRHGVRVGDGRQGDAVQAHDRRGADDARTDGRSRAAAPAHLARWLASLAVLVIYSPRWLFLYAGLFLLAFGLFTAFVLLPGAVKVGNVEFDIHTFVVACISVLVGIQALSFGAVARQFATVNRLLPPSRAFSGILAAFTLERVLVAAVIIALCGVAGVIACVAQWASTDFGPLEYTKLLRLLILSLTAIAIGMQLALTGFLSAIVEIPVRSQVG